MDEFWRELKDTTQAQSSEIHGLKSVLMEAFAWVEEAKSRTQQLNCPMYVYAKFWSFRGLHLVFIVRELSERLEIYIKPNYILFKIIDIYMYFPLCWVYYRMNNCRYVQLAQSQALDPVSARYIANIKHLVYYVENQLRQLNEQLDCRWLEFQDSCKPSVKWVLGEIYNEILSCGILVVY